MKYVLGGLILLSIAYAGYQFFRIRGLVAVSKRLFAQTTPYQSGEGTFSILVLGDSTAVGVGAGSSAESIPGLLGGSLGASVENHGVSGAVTAEVGRQLTAAAKKHYDLVLIQVGANDIVSFNSLASVDTQMRALLTSARKYSDRIVILTGGRIGDAPIVPLVLRPLLNDRAAQLRTLFRASSRENAAAYVDLYGEPSDVYASDPAKYYAADGFHPSSTGYELLFASVKKAITGQWPGEVYGR